MFCTNCGAQTEGATRFCTQCGKATVTASPPQKIPLTKLLSGSGAGTALLCFFLPWITVSCQGMPLSFSFSGWALAVGTTIEKQRIPGEPILFLVLLGAIALIPLSLLGSGRGRDEVRNLAIARAVASAAPTVLLLYKSAQWNNEVQRQAGGLLRLDFQPWFFLTILAFIVAGVGGFLELRERRGRIILHPMGQTHEPARVCSRCGSANAGNHGFCIECGERIAA